MSEVVGRPLCCSFQSLFHVVAKVAGVFQQSTSRVLEVADSVHIFNLIGKQTSGLMENVGLNTSMFLSSLSRPFSNRLRDTTVFAAIVVLVIRYTVS